MDFLSSIHTQDVHAVVKMTKIEAKQESLLIRQIEIGLRSSVAGFSGAFLHWTSSGSSSGIQPSSRSREIVVSNLSRNIRSIWQNLRIALRWAAHGS